jgi:hypothetical protein
VAIVATSTDSIDMARKKLSAPKEMETFMFPSLHQDVVNTVSNAVTSTQVNNEDSDEASNNEHAT